MEYYSALKRKETLTNTIIWMNLEDIKWNKLSQKDEHCLILLTGGPKSS